MIRKLLLLAFVFLGGSALHAQCAPPNYCANTGVGIAALPGLPNMGTQNKNGTTWYDPSLPSAHPSLVFRCTDQSMYPVPTGTIAHQSKSAGIGGSGDGKGLVNVNDTMLVYNTNGGAHHITLFNASTLTCGDPVTGYPITANKNQTNPGSNTTVYNFGSGQFDATDSGAPAGSSIYYAVTGTDAVNTTTAKYVISQTDGTFTVTAPYSDLTYGLPAKINKAPAWAPTTAYVTGDYVSATLTGIPDWNGTTAWSLGDLILPLTNNPANCAFKLSTSGTRGTQPTSWSTGTTCTTAQTKTEGGGTETWRNIGNNGTFVFQLISVNGTSGGSTPNWATASGHPDQGSTVSDGVLTWKNVGVLILPNWNSFAGWSFNGNRVCQAYSMNSYGHGIGSYNLDNADQGTGIYVGCYDSSTNVFELLNTLTGIQSQVTCTGGTGSACTGGTSSKLTAQGAALATITGGCTFPIHNAKAGSTLDFVVVAAQGFYTGTCPGPGAAENLYSWQPFAAYNSTTSLVAYNTISNHWTIGKQKFINYGADSQNFGFASGAYGIVLDAANPGATATTNWQVGTPYTTACDIDGVWAPGDTNPPCDFTKAYDSHLGFWNDPLDDDLGPTCGTIYAINGYYNPSAPYQNEEVCVTTTPTWTVGGAIGAYKVYRFTHTFNSIANPDFATQFGISQLSYSGKFLFFTSDWGCSLGDINGNATNNCGPVWLPSTVYTVGQFVNPYQSLAGSGTNYGVWKITVGGTSTATVPWAGPVCGSGNVNATYTDSGGVQYTCMGPANAKGEVFGVLLSPTGGTSAPTPGISIIVPFGY